MFRKRGVVERDDEHLKIDLYDSDALVDDYLGGTRVKLADLKKSNYCKREEALWNKEYKLKTTVTFSTQFISFKSFFFISLNS